MTKTGWRSNTWHATLRVTKEQAATDPPPTIDMLDTYVIVDIPGARRFCRHCQDVRHVKPSCRQGQRQRATANKNAAPPQTSPPQAHQPPQPTTTTPPAQTSEARRPPPHQQPPPQPHQHTEQSMDYEPSYQAYASSLIQDDELLHSTTGTHHHHHDSTTAHDTARAQGGVYDQ
jgi:hypothetical protein